MNEDKNEKVELAIDLKNTDIHNTYGKIQAEHIKLAYAYRNNGRHIQGSSIQKHGEAAELKRIHDLNIEDIKSGNKPQARAAESKIDPRVDFYDGSDAYQAKMYVSDYNSQGEPLGTKTFQALFKGDYYKIRKLVPKGMGEKVSSIAKNREKAYRLIAKDCKSQGDINGYQKNMWLANKCKDIYNTIEEHTITAQEATKLIPNNGMNTTKSMIGTANEAGLKGASSAACVTIIISGASNIYAVISGEKTTEEAVVETAKDTIIAYAQEYGIQTIASILSGGSEFAAENVSNEALSALLSRFAGGTAPTIILRATIEIGKSLIRYSNGEIDETELGIELGEKSVGVIASYLALSMITGPVGWVSVAVSMAAYTAATTVYREVIKTIAETKLDNQRRAALNSLANSYIYEMKRYQERIENDINRYLKDYREISEKGLMEISQGVLSYDFEKTMNGICKIAQLYEVEVPYKSTNDIIPVINRQIPFRFKN